MDFDFAPLPGLLLPWYEKNRRDLPWRRDREPYHVWLSEIMLQQTRVEAVKGYYSRFLAALPTVEALAAADEALCHKLWEGLGYYSRVRNLQKAAKVIVEQHGGVFPADYDAIRALPGVGDYTAGAIGSISFELPTPAVDGNVLRVASRLALDETPIDTPAVKKALTNAWPPFIPQAAAATSPRRSWSWGPRCAFQTVRRSAITAPSPACAAPTAHAGSWTCRCARPKSPGGRRP